MFSHYLIGEIGNSVSISSLAPSNVLLPASFGNAKITVTGDFPVNSNARIAFDDASGKPFALEFSAPSGARLKSVWINGESVSLDGNVRGFYTVTRPWKKGDTIAIEFEYLLKHHVQTAKAGEKWTAFTYGPWALAQQLVKGSEVDEPFRDKGVTLESALDLLEPVAVEQGTMPSFRIKGTNITLMPYFIAGSLETGPRTYFRFD